MLVNGLGTTMPNVIPLNDKNAIQSAAFAIEFSEQVSPEVVQKFIAFHKQDADMRRSYPRVQPIEMMSFQVGVGGAASPTSLKTLGGVTFDFLESDGTQKIALNLRPDALIFNCAKYENWESVSEEAIKALQSVSHLCEGMKVSAIGLEYLDIFKVNDVGEKGWLKELFQEGTKFVPSHILDSVGFWHNHQGFFTKALHGKYDLLNNIMIDCVPGDETNIVQIRSQHKVTSLINADLQSLFSDKEIQTIFAFEHEATRTILEELLSENMLLAIGMRS